MVDSGHAKGLKYGRNKTIATLLPHFSLTSLHKGSACVGGPIVQAIWAVSIGLVDMSQDNLSEFYDRVARLENARSRGLGFEADGTLGRSHYYRPARRRLRLVAPMMIVILGFMAVKVALHYQVGDGLYQERVEHMLSGQGLEWLGGVFMQADPVTVWLSEQVQRLVG
jgi:hypothetical protein